MVIRQRITGWGRRALTTADAAANRVYGWRHNPLYHSGALTLALLAVVLGTGIYLVFFYRIGAPYASVARLTDQVWLGRWIRTLHRYASDAAVVFAAIHAFRMLVQERSWGPRALAWVSGLVLLGVVFVCGWTGYVMIWDAHGLALAREGARLLDALPLFSEPISRGFVGERAVPNAFFFLNLFLHVALPVALGLVLWVHVARIARPALWPPRALTWGGLAVLLGLSLVVPAALGPEADLLRLHGAAPFDWFYSFWLPASVRLPVGGVWGLGLALGSAAVLLPWLWRPARVARPGPSVVNERLCSGCRQCYLDCPYEAIAMVEREDGRPGVV
ncbi:MAG: cytochrome b N-terminal domain-containing protein, partial [Gemmatimonadota bacterium]|nr:cytochrome b N-terminal domain-containing protein [Gemmatimonadota bacterium]